MKYVIYSKETKGCWKYYFGLRFKDDYPVNQAQLFDSPDAALEVIRSDTVAVLNKKTLKPLGDGENALDTPVIYMPDYLTYEIREVRFSPEGDRKLGKKAGPDLVRLFRKVAREKAKKRR